MVNGTRRRGAAAQAGLAVGLMLPGLLGLVPLTAAATGSVQDAGAPPSGRDAAERPATGGPARADDAAREGSEADARTDAREGRFPLIREGSRLVRVRGLVDRDPRTRTLRLTIDESDPQSPGHRLVLMPSSRLTELEMVLGAAPTVQATMIVTGRVYVYDGRNYLLLTHPAVPDERTLLAPSGDAAGEGDTTAADTDADAAGDGDGDGDDDSVDEIARELERSVGPVGRRAPLGAAAAEGDGPGRFPAAMNVGRLMPEGTRLVDRRGKIRRTPGGGFVFVFDADTSGASDPPVMLLPCRLLEDLARIASGSGDEAAVLISGELTIHDGRNYLLPSVYRIPREQTQLRP